METPLSVYITLAQFAVLLLQLHPLIVSSKQAPLVWQETFEIAKDLEVYIRLEQKRRCNAKVDKFIDSTCILHQIKKMLVYYYITIIYYYITICSLLVYS